MEKDQSLNSNANEEELVISSTGYGLESVSTKKEKVSESKGNKNLDSFYEGY